MVSGSTLSYSVMLWIATGLFLLRIDAVGFKLARLETERKSTRFAGWFNLAVGCALMAWVMFR
ncbi:CLC_0170 family protein [Cohnella caldifontis]|uniref:CLC_0170 family protein n=1 Tax=Cohnella caldifontis TaxID=3027471 RepID=UPI0023ECCC3F|nr:CLC_0170 family protein [Cohnella sp. YIM B05605]